jgi:hypothetical protein
MTALQPPGFMQALTNHSALTMRRNTMLNGTNGLTPLAATIPVGGVHPTYGTRFTATGSGAGMQVTVGSGLCAIPHSASFGGLYSAVNDGDVTVNIDAADATQYRRDVIIAEILDTSDGDGSDLWQLRAVKGSLNATSPAPLPSLPAKSIQIAVVNVDPGVTNLTGRVFDGRTWLAAPGGTLQGLNASLPASAPRGTLYTAVDANNPVYYYTGSAWSLLGDAGWQTYTPAVQNWGAATFSMRYGRYKQLSQKVYAVSIVLVTSHAGSGSATVQVGLPVNPARGYRQNLTVATEFTGGGTPGFGFAPILGTGSGVWIDRIRLLDTSGHGINVNGGDVQNAYECYIHGVFEAA